MSKEDAALRIARGLVEYSTHRMKTEPGFKMTMTPLADALRPLLAAEYPKRVLVDGRDEVFDALAVASGYNLAILTKSAAARVAKAKSEIMAVSPQVTVAQIEHVAKKLAAKFTGAPVTPTSIAAHWSEFGTPPTAAEKARLNPYKEPAKWQETLRTLGRSRGWDAMTVLDYSTKPWADLPLTIRQEIVRENNA